MSTEGLDKNGVKKQAGRRGRGEGGGDRHSRVQFHNFLHKTIGRIAFI